MTGDHADTLNPLERPHPKNGHFPRNIVVRRKGLGGQSVHIQHPQIQANKKTPALDLTEMFTEDDRIERGVWFHQGCLKRNRCVSR